MRLVERTALKAGHKLGKSVLNENGKVLINHGVELSDRMIQRLGEMEITYVYIQDNDTEDILVDSPISEELRNDARKKIKRTFEEVKGLTNKHEPFIHEKVGFKMRSVVRDILSELQQNREVISLLSDVFTYDDYILTHSMNVTIYALALARELGYSQKELEEIGIGAILHDVGKLGVPKDILLKPGKLSNDEFEKIKHHCEEGFNILRKSATIPLVAAHCAYQHHERLDGSGYPRGIKEHEIHRYAKVLAIADVFDAVTSNRVYRNAMLPHEGLEVLYSGSDHLFAKPMLEAFRRCVAVYPNGLTVELSNGQHGVVSRQNKHLCDRPIVRVLSDGKPFELDLSEQLNVVITKCHTTFAS
ncbi:HD-GYP domain-containing protein [Thalassobacillus hwangdonensis]|uniref:HD-GYP domain-containing protein n=1 Tax=Thalassobacillus hwangdonensis TaxID=546108 RepID=A0ABW3L331_9BACI